MFCELNKFSYVCKKTTMNVIRVCIACLFLVCMVFIFNSCKTAKKHKCKDCPTFTHINDVNKQNNNTHEI